ncbi:MAG: hypothetical protein ACLQVY_07140 [Limisphaerales bacterium]
MKNAYLYFVAAIALACIAGLAHEMNLSHNKLIIERVFRQHAKAQAQLQGRNDAADERKGLNAYVRALQAIDASKCPGDFRKAWNDYVAARAENTELLLSATQQTNTAEMTAWLEKNKLRADTLGAVMDKSQDRAFSSYQHCVRIAASYGIKFQSVNMEPGD